MAPLINWSQRCKFIMYYFTGGETEAHGSEVADAKSIKQAGVREWNNLLSHGPIIHPLGRNGSLLNEVQPCPLLLFCCHVGTHSCTRFLFSSLISLIGMTTLDRMSTSHTSKPFTHEVKEWWSYLIANSKIMFTLSKGKEEIQIIILVFFQTPVWP